jgi:hypothetical protein
MSLAECFEEKLSTSPGKRHVTEFIDDQQLGHLRHHHVGCDRAIRRDGIPHCSLSKCALSRKSTAMLRVR